MGTKETTIPWQLTAWLMNGKGDWKQQPVITAEGVSSFIADHPDAYIEKLREMHDDPIFARGPFYEMIGQLKDGLDQHWETNLSGTRSKTNGRVRGST